MKLFLVMLLVAGGAQAEERVTAGHWEATTDTEGDSHTAVYCMIAKDAAALNADSKTRKELAIKKAGTRCWVKTYEAVGDTLTYSLVCVAAHDDLRHALPR